MNINVFCYYLKDIKYLYIESKRIFGDFKNEALLELKKRNIYRKILASPAVTLKHESAQIEICSLTSKQDYQMLIMALKSFFRFMGLNFSVLILNDGTLSIQDEQVIQFHIQGVTIISKEQLFEKIKKEYKEKSSIYALREMPYVRKKIGAYLFSTKQKMLFMDSDILFFKKPTEIDSWINNTFDAFYIKDLENSYMLSEPEAKFYFNVNLYPKVNSGLLGISKENLNVDILEKVCDLYLNMEKKLSVHRIPQFQTFFSILFSQMKKQGKKILALPENYLISNSMEENDQKVICRHYVRFVRSIYFRDVAKVIAQLR